jgi:hypothetical protein
MVHQINLLLSYDSNNFKGETKHNAPPRTNACIFFCGKKNKYITNQMLGKRKGKGRKGLATLVITELQR